MGIKHSRIIEDRLSKKKIKDLGLTGLSSGGETPHYIERCLERKGVLEPHQKMKIKKMIKSGKIIVRKRKRKKVELIFPDTGERRIVSEFFMRSITFMN